MRTRLLSPDFFSDERIVMLQPLTRILFQGLWCAADREGRLDDKPIALKLKVLAADNCDVNALLNELAASGLIVRYEAMGRKCIWIPAFLRHQNPHKREKPSLLPAWPGPDLGQTQDRPEHDLGTAFSAGTNLQPSREFEKPDLGSTRPGGEGEGEDPVSVTVSVSVRDPAAAPAGASPPPFEKVQGVLDKVYAHNRPGDRYPWPKKCRDALGRLLAAYPPQLIAAKWLDATSSKRTDWPKNINTLVELETHWAQVKTHPRVIAQFNADFAPSPSNIVPLKANGGSA